MTPSHLHDWIDMTCPNCTADSTEPWKYCPHCGTAASDKANSTPSTLYRFRPAHDIVRLLRELEGEFWLSTAKYLNDPLDGIGKEESPPIEWVRGVPIPDSSKSCRLEFREKRIAATGCLVPDVNNIQMWAQYANGGNGVAIGYDTASLEVCIAAHADETKARAAEHRKNGRVVPSITYPSLGRVEYSRAVGAQRKPEPACFFEKHRIWSHEHEWRVAGEDLVDANDNPPGFRMDLAAAITNVVFGYKFSLAPLAILSIAKLRVQTGNLVTVSGRLALEGASRLHDSGGYEGRALKQMVGAIEAAKTWYSERHGNDPDTKFQLGKRIGEPWADPT